MGRRNKSGDDNERVRQSINSSGRWYKLIKNSTINIHGVLYFPGGYFSWINIGTPTITALRSAFILDGFSLDGSGTIKIPFNLAASDIPYPAGLNAVPKPGKVRLLY